MIDWRPHLDPLLCGVVLLAVALAAWMLYLRIKAGPRGSAPFALFLPKVLAAAFLVLALLEPVIQRERREEGSDRVLVLVDRSGSMRVADGEMSRYGRARSTAERLRAMLPADIGLELQSFDTGIHEDLPDPAGPDEDAGTDLGACLLELGKRDLSDCAALLLITDGGDTVIEDPALPPVPLSVLGVGSVTGRWNDVRIEAFRLPGTVEEGTGFEATVDVTASSGSLSFARRLGRVTLRLERRTPDGSWEAVKRRSIDLGERSVRERFRLEAGDGGVHRYRAVLPEVEGEISALNNAREGALEVRTRSSQVLYFTRRLGTAYKMVRGELGRDPGIAFTGMFRTIGERFTVVGEDVDETGALEKGFPESVEALRRYDTVILGAFPADEWSPAQIEALRAYVEQGGTAVFLAGTESYGARGYPGTPLEDLLPWRIAAGDAEMLTGAFPVTVPPQTRSHPAVRGLADALAETSATVESLSPAGTLKPGAEALLYASTGEGRIPLVAWQAFGRGKVLAFQSNTFWKWSRRNEALREAYGTFWRQTARWLAGAEESGTRFSYRWDREHYAPGDRAQLEIRSLGASSSGRVEFSAVLERDGELEQVSVREVEGVEDTWRAGLRFRRRGHYLFTLTANENGRTVETYEKRLPVFPKVGEGARLELDEAFLRRLAQQGGGAYGHESRQDEFLQKFARGMWRRTVTIEEPLMESRYAVGAFLLVLVIEWIIRRRRNLF
ncbi:glutamine amidotransferase [Kiritimatiella glycovorans]|uniref:Putative glutamine amidotransferase domain-containing protein n=1 Tax=Kiritimatiella glycovorans TaxID=1307763 RepID=A0A0G3EGX9_9BACT|nr:glutamine amidotransferase [Kiritimatiella glycovorans]AKJ63384.1 hypothetical protein L21SP4_00098 [Kiritimatiella glycovorans]